MVIWQHQPKAEFGVLWVDHMPLNKPLILDSNEVDETGAYYTE